MEQEIKMKPTIEVAVGAVFEADYLRLAYEDMMTFGGQVTNNEVHGLSIGSTRPNGGGYFAVYDVNGFFVATLNFAWGTNQDGRVEALATPLWLLDLVGTEFEGEAKQLSCRLARASEPDGLGAEEVWAAIAQLQERVKDVRKAA